MPSSATATKMIDLTTTARVIIASPLSADLYRRPDAQRLDRREVAGLGIRTCRRGEPWACCRSRPSSSRQVDRELAAGEQPSQRRAGQVDRQREVAVVAEVLLLDAVRGRIGDQDAQRLRESRCRPWPACRASGAGCGGWRAGRAARRSRRCTATLPRCPTEVSIVVSCWRSSARMRSAGGTRSIARHQLVLLRLDGARELVDALDRPDDLGLLRIEPGGKRRNCESRSRETAVRPLSAVLTSLGDGVDLRDTAAVEQGRQRTEHLLDAGVGVVAGSGIVSPLPSSPDRLDGFGGSSSTYFSPSRLVSSTRAIAFCGRWADVNSWQVTSAWPPCQLDRLDVPDRRAVDLDRGVRHEIEHVGELDLDGVGVRAGPDRAGQRQRVDALEATAASATPTATAETTARIDCAAASRLARPVGIEMPLRTFSNARHFLGDPPAEPSSWQTKTAGLSPIVLKLNRAL